jgi:DNA repair protein RadD
MILRPNQVDPVTIGIEFFNTKKIAPSVIVAPTAFGKSIVIAFITKGVKDKILVLQPTKELLEQNYEKFINLGGEASVYSASMGIKEIGDVTYATLGSVIAVAQEFKKLGFTKVIIDECDRYPREKDGLLRRFVEGINITHVLGLTATPLKLQTNADGEGGSYSKLVMLTNWSKKGTFFNHILYVAQIQDIVKLGYWTKLEYQSYEFDTGKLVYNSTKADYTAKSMERAYEKQDIESQIIKKVREVTDRKSILIAVPTIDQATDLAGKIPNAAIVHGGTPKKERRRIIEEFKSQRLRVVVQVNVLTVGFDYPQLDCIITGRPTNSISWWYQFVGRGTRIHENKENCLVVDFVGSTQRFGKVEDLYYSLTKNDKGEEDWQLYGQDSKQITGVPLHEIGFKLEDGTDRSVVVREDGDIEKVFMTFGKYKTKEVRKVPPFYRKWLLEKFEWSEWNMKIKIEIERLNSLTKR